jgi:hypothetical protein
LAGFLHIIYISIIKVELKLYIANCVIYTAARYAYSFTINDKILKEIKLDIKIKMLYQIKGFKKPRVFIYIHAEV